MDRIVDGLQPSGKQLWISGWPDRKSATGRPYEDVENIRPETKAMVQTWLQIYGDARDIVLGVEAAGN